jgi:hypothetical protein
MREAADPCHGDLAKLPDHGNVDEVKRGHDQLLEGKRASDRKQGGIKQPVERYFFEHVTPTG